MFMSIIDELLVFLDDKEELSLDEIKSILSNRTRQTISSALGRLCSKGWIKSQNTKLSKSYKITHEGRKQITLSLNRIRDYENNNWDGSYLISVFSIPEKKRRLRDIFRKNLIEMGFSRLQNDLWVSFWDKRKDVDKIINSLDISKYCTIFKIDKLSKIDQDLFIYNLNWNKDELNKLYKIFIKNTDKYLKSKKDGFGARLLVYEYSKVLLIDPKFPNSIIPNDYLGIDAYNQYLKVRPYCYK